MTDAADELDLYDDKVQQGIAWALRQVGEVVGAIGWDMGDGSESVEGDVGAEIHNILVAAGLRCPETNELATLARPELTAAITINLVKGPVYGDLAIRHWINHGLKEGEHRLYAAPVDPKPASGEGVAADIARIIREKVKPNLCRPISLGNGQTVMGVGLNALVGVDEAARAILAALAAGKGG